MVEIKGGVSYFLYDGKYTGNCKINGLSFDLNRYDIIPTSITETDISLINKFSEIRNISKICRGQSYSGIASNDIRLKDEPNSDNDILCYVSINKGLKKYINKDQIKNIESIEKWKVFTARSSTKGGSGFGKYFYIGKPNEICNQSYIVFLVETEKEAISLKSYLQTKFCNKLLSLRKISQDSKPDTCKWIPLVSFETEWTDEKLFTQFNLSNNEIKLISDFKL